MQRDILFYQANFEPEVARMLKAYESENQKHFLLFQNKTLKIIDTILGMSKNFAEKEEWFALRNITEYVDQVDNYSKKVLANYGLPFSQKFAYRLASTL